MKQYAVFITLRLGRLSVSMLASIARGRTICIQGFPFIFIAIYHCFNDIRNRPPFRMLSIFRFQFYIRIVLSPLREFIHSSTFWKLWRLKIIQPNNFKDFGQKFMQSIQINVNHHRHQMMVQRITQGILCCLVLSVSSLLVKTTVHKDRTISKSKNENRNGEKSKWSMKDVIHFVNVGQPPPNECTQSLYPLIRALC